jgi:hypothetical protein
VALLHGGLCSAAADFRETDLCRRNLGTVFRALQQYRTEHRTWPDQLTELVPSQLSSAELLRCPAISSAAGTKPDKTSRPEATGRYLYEFESKPLTNDLVRDLGTTLRSWRQWQMGKVGSGVPLLRCPHHSRFLNLSFDGEFYESGPDWEERFAAVVRPEDLRLERLLQESVRREIIRIAARPAGLSAAQMDLTLAYNGLLGGWLDPVPNESLAELASGPLLLDGVAFDARGVIQLRSHRHDLQHYPAAVSNITVGLRCQELVFLHGTVQAEAPGTAVGQYTIHFEDGKTEVFVMKYGRDVLEWRGKPARNGSNLQPAWTGPVTGSSGTQRRLYASRWANPHPNLKILHIDFVSTMAQSSPFLVALSGEMPTRKR